MKINVLPAKENLYAKKGILIKGKSPNEWLPILQLLKIDILTTIVFPVPSKIANELYGCFILLDEVNISIRGLNVTVFQSVHDYIYIPEFSEISPVFSKEEAKEVFKLPHIFHPNFDWVTLNESVDWGQLLEIKTPEETIITKPSKTVFSPKMIKSFQLIADEEIDIVKELGLTVAPPKKDTLTSFDKAKLKLFKSIFSSEKNEKGGFDIKGKGLFKWLKNNDATSNSKSKSKWEKDFEKLLFRNQKETDKLLSLFKSNPSLALSRAIPIDMLGTSRGSGGGLFKVFKAKEGEKDSSFFKFIANILTGFVILSVLFLVVKSFGGIVSGNFSDFFFILLKIIGIIVVFIIIASLSKGLNKAKGSGDSIANIDSERMNALRKEYEKLANEAIKNEDYKKAASIYMKLLKNNHAAAAALVQGQFYQEAALIHLKYTKNKELAAKTYESGKFYEKAIDIYKEINQNEKVGDLYKSLQNTEEANKHFQIVIDDYMAHSQYVKASLLYKYKVEDNAKAKEPLLKGWREKNDAYNCLNNYFSNFSDQESLKKGIQFIYSEETNNTNINQFLKALKEEHKKHKDLQGFTKNLAYEVVAKMIKDNPSIAFSLNSFNTENSLLNTDASKFVRIEKKKKR